MTFLWGFTAGWWVCSLSCLAALAIWKLRRPPPPTKHARRNHPCPGAEILTDGNGDFLAPYHRKNRDAPERNLSREIHAGMAELNERDSEDRVRYEFLGQTGFEE